MEDLLVKVDGFSFPTDLVILDMPEDTETPLILGRPFLETGMPLIDVELGNLALRFKKEQVFFNVFEVTKNQHEQPQCYTESKMRNSLKKKKLARTLLKIGQRVHWWKSRLKGWLGVFRCMASGTYTIHKICEYGSVEFKDPGESKVFSVKGKEMRAFHLMTKHQRGCLRCS